MNAFTISDVRASREIPNHPFALAVASTLQSHFAYSMPDKVGVIAAGQAVSSAILELLGLGDAPFRDLDLFWLAGENIQHPKNNGVLQYGEMRINYHGEEVTVTKAARHIKTVGGVREVSVYHEPSFGELMHETVIMDDYAILNTFNDETNASLNHILVGITYFEDRQNLHANQIINAFDINCCQAAFIPATMTLVITDAFLAFLETLTLSIVSFNTAMHSGIRLEKKVKDLPFANVDMDSEIKRLQTYRKMIMLIEDKRREVLPDGYWPIYGNAFSDIYRDRFLATSERLQNAFNLSKHSFCFENTYLGKSKAGDNVSFKTKEDVTLYFLEPESFDEKFIETAPLLLNSLSLGASPVMVASYIPLIHLLTDKPDLKSSYLALINLEEAATYNDETIVAAMMVEKAKRLVVKEPTINTGHFNEAIQSTRQVMALVESGNPMPANIVLPCLIKLLKVTETLQDFYTIPAVINALLDTDFTKALDQRDAIQHVTFTSFPKRHEIAACMGDIRTSIINGLKRDLENTPAFPNYIPNIVAHVNEKMAGAISVKAIETPAELVEKHFTSFGIESLKGLLAVLELTLPDGTSHLAKITAPYEYSYNSRGYSFTTGFYFCGEEKAGEAAAHLNDAIHAQMRVMLGSGRQKAPFSTDISSYPYPMAWTGVNGFSNNLMGFDENIPF